MLIVGTPSHPELWRLMDGRIGRGVACPADEAGPPNCDSADYSLCVQQSVRSNNDSKNFAADALS
jgi:hypothetical protein